VKLEAIASGCENRASQGSAHAMTFPHTSIIGFSIDKLT
jgi:hypothetical protein